MAHETLDRTIDSETDRRVIIDNLHPPLVRKMIIGSSWTKLRIGIRLSNGRATALTSPPYFYMGLCSGLTAPPLSATPNHFVGFRSTSSNWVSSSGNPGCFPNVSNSFSLQKIEDGVVTSTDFTAGGNPSYIRNSTQGRSALFLEVEKGSPWTVRFYHEYASPSASSQVSISSFASAMAAPSVPSQWALRGTLTPTIDEATYGYLDSICFAFAGVTDPFEVCDFVYAELP